MKKTFISLIFMLLGSFLATTAAYADGQREFEARLRGKFEVPPVDTNMRGNANVNFKKDLTTARVRLRVDKKGDPEIIQAHLHCAPEGVNGPIVVFLLTPIAQPPGATYNGRTEILFNINDGNLVSPAIVCGDFTLDSIENLFNAMDAGNIYANVHTPANPGGEIRGQLRRDDD